MENEQNKIHQARYFVAGSTLLSNFLAEHENIEDVSDKKLAKKGEREYNITGIDKQRHISVTPKLIFLIDKGSNITVIDTIPEETKIKNVVDYRDSSISEKRLIAFIKGE